jgi:hypothetical protein
MFFFTRNEIGKRNKAKNIELKRNLAVFSYVKRKLLNQSEAKKSKKQKTKKSKKNEEKQKNRLEFRFALFRFEAKITKVKRSEKFEVKISEKMEVKFYSEQAKHM